ncbi:MAG: SLBB domain-containing protein [Bacteroidota bacterium]
MHKRYLIKGIFLSLCLFFSSQALQAQDLLKGRDLSQVKADQLSDADIAKLKAQLNGAGMTIDQAEQIALSKGMSSAEFTKLKQRLAVTGTNNNSGTGKLKSGTDNSSATRTNNSSDSLDKETYGEKPPRPLINPLIFGSELYTSVSPGFEPNMKLATPLNYVLGPDDQLQVSVYGVQEYTGELRVSAEGSVSIPNVGQIKVAGMTIEAATQKLRSVMGNSVYRTLMSGASKLSVTLGNIRTIRVTVIGSSRPANYNLSSLSTVFNALYVAGGPSAFGSFREIELWRNDKMERKIDLYRLMLTGNQSDNVGLKDNDVIRIPAYKTRVELQGQVKRPGIFEVLPGESFTDILGFASGFTDTAYRASVKVYQLSDKERKVQDLESTAYTTYHPQSGDVFIASKLLNRFQNRVRITGAVFRPDVYQLTPGLRVADLIRKADGLKEDAFTGRGQIIRLQEDLSRSIVSFDVKKALAGDASNNDLLRREDEVLISSVLDLRDSFRITIQGEVRLPGQYEYADGLTLKDLILQAGGFTDAAFKHIEIARLIKRDSIGAMDTRANTIIGIDIYNELGAGFENISLMPFDVVTIRRKSGYILPQSVMVTGQVQYPGSYVLSNLNERVSDVLKRAGGYIPDAYPEGAYLKRYTSDQDRQRAEDVAKKIEKTARAKDSTSIMQINEEIMRDFDRIPLDLVGITKNPGSNEDLVLKARDELFIPQFTGGVKISGAVLIATQVPFKPDNSFKDYINDAGGYAADAAKSKAIVVYANGKASPIKHFLFFKFYPKVLPGSEIVVNKRVAKKPLTTVEFIGLSSALASLAGLVIALLR